MVTCKKMSSVSKECLQWQMKEDADILPCARPGIDIPAMVDIFGAEIMSEKVFSRRILTDGAIKRLGVCPIVDENKWVNRRNGSSGSVWQSASISGLMCKIIPNMKEYKKEIGGASVMYLLMTCEDPDVEDEFGLPSAETMISWPIAHGVCNEEGFIFLANCGSNTLEDYYVELKNVNPERELSTMINILIRAAHICAHMEASRISHNDFQLRNICYDEKTGGMVIIDFDSVRANIEHRFQDFVPFFFSMIRVLDMFVPFNQPLLEKLFSALTGRSDKHVRYMAKFMLSHLDVAPGDRNEAHIFAIREEAKAIRRRLPKESEFQESIKKLCVFDQDTIVGNLRAAMVDANNLLERGAGPASRYLKYIDEAQQKQGPNKNRSGLFYYFGYSWYTTNTASNFDGIYARNGVIKRDWTLNNVKNALFNIRMTEN